MLGGQVHTSPPFMMSRPVQPSPVILLMEILVGTLCAWLLEASICASGWEEY